MPWPAWIRRRFPPARTLPRSPAVERLEPRIALSVTLGLVPAGEQPQGPLSGRIVYTSAGHGWQWSSTLGRWATDRPNLLSMVEDFGNQDQMTLYAEYLFQAGATVVPMRPVGRQLNEVVLDNDSPEVIWDGLWSNNTAGPRWFDEDAGAVTDPVKYRFARVDAAAETASATYAPTIPESGRYPVYAWATPGANRTDQRYLVRHLGGTTEVRVDHRAVGNGWVWLGSYEFAAGRSVEQGAVTISNFSTAGGSVVIADAIRFGNGMGDVRWGAGGPGSGSVSGYPREDEGSLLWLWRGVGQSTSFSSPSAVIGTSNVSAPLRMAEHMNVDTNPYGKSVYIGFHSNASTGNPATASSRGALGLIHSSNPTPNQAALAAATGRQINDDMRALDGSFEHDWSTRTAATLSGGYGEINNFRVGGEFDATIIEVAFHDNTFDTELLRDPRVRDQLARSTYEATLEHFFNHPGSLPRPANLTLPSPPQRVWATSDAAGQLTVSWEPGPSSPGGFAGVFGSPATGFRVHASLDGRGFDGGTFVAGGGSRSVTLTDLDPGRPYFLKVVAENGGGRSRASELLGVLPDGGDRQVLIVNGFDRLDRSQNFVQAYAYGGGTTERVRPDFNNPKNQVVPAMLAMQQARPGIRVDAASNEAVIDGSVRLADYEAVVWILGNESQVDQTFDPVEQGLATAYLAGGGNLFVSGSEIGYELDGWNAGEPFFREVLGARYVADDAGTHQARAVAGSIFESLGDLRFSDGAAFSSLPDQSPDIRYPDVLAAEPGSQAVLEYAGGQGAAAATYRPAADGRGAVVVLGFPFESIEGAEPRAELMRGMLDAFGIEPPAGEIILEAAAGEELIDGTVRGGPVPLITRGEGRVILPLANEHTGGTRVEAGELVLRNASGLGTGPLEIGAAATLRFDVGTARVAVPSLTIGAGSLLDLGGGSLVVAAGGYDLETVRELIVAARDGGSWAGRGITSTSIEPGGFREVGYLVTSAGELVIGFAAVGDTNLDGSVTIQDLVVMSAFGKYAAGGSDASWWEGDFNYDGRVDVVDLILLSTSGLYSAGSYLPTGGADSIEQAAASKDIAASSDSTATGGGDAPFQIGQLAWALLAEDDPSGSRPVAGLRSTSSPGDG